MKTLILTEKPSVSMEFVKALGINGKHGGYYENDRYVITWAVGHLVTLCEPAEYDPRYKQWSLNDLPIIPDELKYKPLKQTAGQLNVIKGILKRKDVETVVIATDAGREGEVIARTILNYCGENKKLKRFWSSQALTPAVILDGMKNLAPASAYDRLWHAGQSRQIADWIVGLNFTRAITKLNTGDLFSVGRVQTAVLALIVNRHKERTAFKPEPYWTITLVVSHQNGNFAVTYFKEKKTSIDQEDRAKEIFDTVKETTGNIFSVEKTKKTEKPKPLYNLTELQRDANRLFGFTAKKTLDLAQDLYEKHKCLSYPRTESQVLGSENVDFVKSIIDDLKQSYDIFQFVRPDLISAKNKRVFDDSRLTDHHALIPLKSPETALSQDEANIFDLVLRRFCAAFYEDHEYEKTVIIVQVAGHMFRAVGKTVLVSGWKSVYTEELNQDDENKEDDNQLLPQVEKADPVKVIGAQMKKKMTMPPPEYTESSLLDDMSNPQKYVDPEFKGIFKGEIGLGTQATRAAIIELLIDREYITRAKKALIATRKGIFLIDFINSKKETRFIASPENTAQWELKLSKMAAGETITHDEFISEIKRVVTECMTALKGQPGQAPAFEKSGIGKCPVCGKSVIKTKNGFLCSGYQSGCKFGIWKEIAGKTISETMVKDLLEKGRTKKLKGFKSKAGKPFDAVLIIKDGKTSFDF